MNAATAGRYVFVYGTLRRGERNDITRLQPAPRYLGAAALPGTLYDLGAYPGLLLAHPEAAEVANVVGEVYAIEPALEQRLDEIEGILPEGSDSSPEARNEYAKRQRLVDVAGQRLVCLVYEINADRIYKRPVIANGDWVRRSKFSQYENL